MKLKIFILFTSIQVTRLLIRKLLAICKGTDILSMHLEEFQFTLVLTGSIEVQYRSHFLYSKLWDEKSQSYFLQQILPKHL
jgi:hypothetical protein